MGNPLEKFNIDENKSELEVMMELFDDYVVDYLEKNGELRLAEQIQDGSLNIELEKKRVFNMGENQENSNKKDDIEFNASDFLLKKASDVAKDLIANKNN